MSSCEQACDVYSLHMFAKGAMSVHIQTCGMHQVKVKNYIILDSKNILKKLLSPDQKNIKIGTGTQLH